MLPYITNNEPSPRPQFVPKKDKEAEAEADLTDERVAKSPLKLFQESLIKAIKQGAPDAKTLPK